jgi:hypothetical protein
MTTVTMAVFANATLKTDGRTHVQLSQLIDEFVKFSSKRHTRSNTEPVKKY